MAQRKGRHLIFVKIFIGLWLLMVLSIMTYLHYPPQTGKKETANSSQTATLKSFYSSVNQHNTYLNPANIHNESVVYQLLQRILAQNSNSDTEQTKTVIENIVSKFKFHLQSSNSLCKASDIKHGCYTIIQNSKHDIIDIYGNNIGSIVSGLSHYLSTHWMVSISWNGNNLNCLFEHQYLDTVIGAQKDGKTSIYASRNFEYTYYKNPCTDSYSMVWWDWDRWQKELDFMVLQNINLLLLPTLNELIEYELYTQEYGLTNDELSTYFVGPAFLAWFRMGNLRGWPQYFDGDKHRRVGLTQHWFKQQLTLTYKIIARCIELEIDIILPAFSGHVPQAFVKRKPNTNFYDGSKWFGMPNELTRLKFLDATDDFYVEIGLKYQKIAYSILSSFLSLKHDRQSESTVFVWLDQYNELTPQSSELSYLQKSGENQLKSMRLTDYSESSGSVQIKWVIQAWMFVHMRSYWTNQRIEHYFKGIDSDDILILDLIAEKGSIAQDSDYFFRHDYIWCFLHNFGGGHALSGNLRNIFRTLSNHKQNKNWKGIGISMEGIHNNPILYHSVLYHSFVTDTDTEANSSDKRMDLYITQYISSRYGKHIFDAQKHEILSIWKELIPLMYESANGKWSVTRSLILKRPRKGIVSGVSEFKLAIVGDNINELRVIEKNAKQKQKPTGFQTTLVDYCVCQLFAIWDRFMRFIIALIASDESMAYNSQTLANDIAEITRQFLSDLFQQMYLALANESEQRFYIQRMMLDIIDETDIVLSDFEYFRLDSWINNARSFGKDTREKDYLELNARNLVTRWGPNGEINDYSSREWNGLMSNYYKIRWETFFDGGDVNEFEKKWQSQTIPDLRNINGNHYQKEGDYKHFYTQVLQIYQKYKGLLHCKS